MKKITVLVFSLFLTLILCGCAQKVGMNTRINQDINSGNWIGRMNLDPMQWVSHADRWFFTGEPYDMRQYALHQPMSAAMSDMIVRVAYFNNIVIEGDFTVQLTGQQTRNSVEVIGPNHAVRQLAVEVRGHTLYLHRAPDCPENLHDVIVRVGINTLNKLINQGNALVLGRGITSEHLAIGAHGNAHIILCGVMRVQKVITTDTATVTVIGTYSRHVNLHAMHNSTINLSGRLGLEHVINAGGNINIIGSDSHDLDLCTRGCSITRIAGYTTLKNIIASENSQIYLYWALGNHITIAAEDCARIYLAGCIANMNIELHDQAFFEGQSLRTTNSYATTSGSSHVNITADQKLFATASDTSSIYYFGSPGNVSRFISGNGTVIPVYTNGIAIPATPYRQPYTWNFH